MGFLEHESDDPDTNRLALAFIWPVHDGGGGNFDQADLPWDMNLEFSEMADIHTQNINRGSVANHGIEFWTVYIQAAFQGPRQYQKIQGGVWWGDNDPNSEQTVGGLTRLRLPGEPAVLMRSWVFMEQINDGGREANWSPEGIDICGKASVAHEIGWQFDCVPGALLMGAATSNVDYTWFEPENIRIIRSCTIPGTHNP